MNELRTKIQLNRLAAFVIISFFLGGVMVWQWFLTVEELDALAEGYGKFDYLLPKVETE